ncbi:MAG TPA: O-antigen ligase family protein [Acidimicrobiales bacterium]|nr:O-antigen ligase family protein [Acidimicrobiales bacterium]
MALGALGLGAVLGRSNGSGATRLALAMLLTGAVAIALLRRDTASPHRSFPGSGGFLFVLLLGVLVLATGKPGTEDISGYEQLVAAAVAMTFLVVVVRMTMDRSEKPLAVVLLLAYAWLILLNAVVAWLFAVDGVSWARQAFVVSAMPLAAIGAWLLPRPRTRLLVGMVVALCAGITLYYLVLLEGAESLYEIRSSYKAAFFRTGGTFAAAIITTLTFPFVLTRTRWRLAYLVVFAVGLAGVGASFARTFWVTTPAAFLVAAAALRGERFGRRALLGLTALVAVLLLVQGTGPGREYSGLARERITQRNLSGSFRAEEAQGLLRTMVAEPTTLALGAGLGNTFTFHSTDPYAVGGIGTVTRDYSHNWYLEVLWTTGIAGLAVIALFLATVMRALLGVLRRSHEDRQSDAWDTLLSAGLLGTFTNFALAAFTYHPFGMLLWNLVLGALFGVACSHAAGGERRPQPAAVGAARAGGPQ